MGDKTMYAVAAVALLVLGFGVFAMPQRQQADFSASAYGTQQSAQFAAPASIPPECGDINDPANLQHLSHHPDQFQACYKVVDSAKFKAAVGQDVSAFINSGGGNQQDSMAGHHG